MIKFFSRLPMRALYAFSSFLYLLAFYVVRHRHAVIREQIAEGVSRIQRAPSAAASIEQFLKNFCDVLVEVLKSASMSERTRCARTCTS